MASKKPEIPQHLADRLIAINHDPSILRIFIKYHNFDLAQLERFVTHQEEEVAQYHEWSPRLFAFAEECRREQPAPSENDLSITERMIQRVIEKLVRSSHPPRSQPNSVLICVLQFVGIPVAQRSWPGGRKDTVILTSDELVRWQEFYPHARTYRWWESCSWRVEVARRRHEPPRMILAWTSRPDLPNSQDRETFEALTTELNEGEIPLIACHGVGPHITDLWAGTDHAVRFVRHLSIGI